MSRRVRITLPDPLMARLQALAEERDESMSRVAAKLVCAEIDTWTQQAPSETTIMPSAGAATNARADRWAPWIEPLDDPRNWRELMWGGICALHRRYPQALAHMKEGWWENRSHVETLCVLVVWRNWIDAAADDPRYELAFHAQLADFSRALRQEGGGVMRAWRPGAAPAAWT